MIMRIGLDFGTTHTSAALYNGHQLKFVPLDTSGEDPNLLRSMIYVTEQHESFVGIKAVQRYLKDNTGRPVKLVWKHVGTIENVFSQDDWEPLIMIREVYVQEDVGAPGRLLQSIKTGLRDKSYTGTNIYDKFFTIQELIAIILSHVRERSEEYLGSEVRKVVLGRPVKFSDDPIIDQYAEKRLREAAELAGFREVTLEREPIAAALFYTSRTYEPKTILVFDFGGGTLDLTVMRIKDQSSLEVLATQGVLVGGDDLDRAIMKHAVAKHFGVNSTIGLPRGPFPSYLASLLEQWQTIPDLSREKRLRIIGVGKAYSDNPQAFVALECLATKNYGFALFERIEQAKRRLSSQLRTRIEMHIEEIDLSESISRKQFEGYISDEIKKAQIGIDEVLDSAGLSEDKIDVVVTTGGASLIPAFQKLLQDRFGPTKVVRSDTFGSVVSGLAIRAYDLDEHRKPQPQP